MIVDTPTNRQQYLDIKIEELHARMPGASSLQLAMEVQRCWDNEPKVPGPVFTVTLTIGYRRTEPSANPPDPTHQELTSHISNLSLDDYLGESQRFRLESPITYVGDLRFMFQCVASTPIDIVIDFGEHSLSDAEWEADPTSGGLVYPSPTGQELGLLYYNTLEIDGVVYSVPNGH